MQTPFSHRDHSMRAANKKTLSCPALHTPMGARGVVEQSRSGEVRRSGGTMTCRDVIPPLAVAGGSGTARVERGENARPEQHVSCHYAAGMTQTYAVILQLLPLMSS